MYIHNKTLKFSTKIDIFNLLSPILAQIILMILCFTVSPLLNQSEENLVIILMLLVFGFVIINLLSYIKNQELEEYRTKAIVLDKEMEHYSREHQIIGEYLKELSILKHNIRHEILPILSKIPHTNDEILSEFNSLFDKVLLEDYRYFSKYSWLDIILNYQLHKAPNVKFSIKIDPNLNIKTDPKIVSIILGNLLDNARECCKEEINIRISNQNSNLFILVENEFTGEIMLENGLPISTKKDAHLHGFGLSSVKQIVEQDDGIFSISHENNRFVAKILLLN
ncbi:MAG: GHKL domain-containing protein [Clostridia bacterium]